MQDFVPQQYQGFEERFDEGFYYSYHKSSINDSMKGYSRVLGFGFSLLQTYSAGTSNPPPLRKPQIMLVAEVAAVAACIATAITLNPAS